MPKQIKKIFIEGEVPSSKNSKMVIGKFLVPSKQTQRYKQETEWIWHLRKNEFLKMIEGKSPPFYVSIKFYRGSRRKFDYINAMQIVQDLMVKHEWIEDDNMEFLIPVFEKYEYRKESPGFELFVL